MSRKGSEGERIAVLVSGGKDSTATLLKRNIFMLLEVEEKLNRQGYMTRLKGHITAKELVRRLELNDAQLDMFCDEVCEICRA